MERNRGRRIRQAMGRRDIRKHCVLANALNVTEGAISRWCQGSPMTLVNTIALCQYLDISADWLLMGRGDMEQHHRHPSDGLAAGALPGICERARPHLMRFLHEAAHGC